MKIIKKRIILFILFCVLIIISVANIPAINVAATITVYSQTDSRWANHQYGYSNTAGTQKATISSGGCGILSYVNAVYYLNGKFIDPIYLADWSVNHGYRVNGVGTAYGLYKAFADSHVSTYGIEYVGSTSSYSTLANHLISGGVAIGSAPGHLMAIVDYDSSSGKFLILDSYKSSNRYTHQTGYTWQTESSCKNTEKLRFSTFIMIKGNEVPTGTNPNGQFDTLVANEGILYLTGWAYDQDDYSQQLKIKVCVGGPAGSCSSEHYILADWYRPDVDDQYPGVGDYHGFSWALQVRERGEQDVYVYAVNIGGGEDVLLGCMRASINDEMESRKIKPGIYCIASSVDAHKVLDIQAASKEDNASLIICDYHGDANQRFRIEVDGEGKYTITPLHSGKKLQLAGTDLVTEIIQTTANGSANQKWKIRSVGDGSYFIISDYTGVFFDLRNAETTNGEKIKTNYPNGSNAERWLFRRLVESVDITLEDGSSAKNVLLNEIGGQYTLSTQTTPTEVFDKNVKWESSDTSVVAVDQNGVITAVGNGSAVIRVTTNDGGFTDCCLVKVNSSQIIYGDLNLDGKISASDLSVLNCSYP